MGLPFPTGKVHDWSRQALRPFAGYAFSDARDLTALRRGTPRQIKGTRLTPTPAVQTKSGFPPLAPKVYGTGGG